MINITINAPRPFGETELHIIAAAFEKLSQLATLYEDAGMTTPMEQHVAIAHNDINMYDLVERTINPLSVDLQQCFLSALNLALHTNVEFTIDTKTGQQTLTSPLLPYVINHRNEVAWCSEPDFIIRLTRQGLIEFQFFNELLDFINADVDGNIKTTMMAGGCEIWSM